MSIDKLTAPIVLIFLLCLTVAPPTSAQERYPTSPGFSGDVLLGIVSINSESQLNTTGDENASIDSLDQDPQAVSTVRPGLLGNVFYTFKSLEDQAYIGVSRSKAVQGRLTPELGYRRLFSPISNFTVAYIPDLLRTDTWSDPFDTDQPRVETDQSLSAVRAKWEGIVNSPVGFELGYGELDIENEQSGISQTGLTAEEILSLRRKAEYSYAGLELKAPVAKGIFFIPIVYFFDRNAEGNAYTHEARGIELGGFGIFGRHRLILNVAYEGYQYDGVNPLFNTIREDDYLKFFFGYFYTRPFGWKNFSFSTIGTYKDRGSNIKFYEEKSSFISLGFNYQF